MVPAAFLLFQVVSFENEKIELVDRQLDQLQITRQIYPVLEQFKQYRGQTLLYLNRIGHSDEPQMGDYLVLEQFKQQINRDIIQLAEASTELEQHWGSRFQATAERAESLLQQWKARDHFFRSEEPPPSRASELFTHDVQMVSTLNDALFFVSSGRSDHEIQRFLSRRAPGIVELLGQLRAKGSVALLAASEGQERERFQSYPSLIDSGFRSIRNFVATYFVAKGDIPEPLTAHLVDLANSTQQLKDVVEWGLMAPLEEQGALSADEFFQLVTETISHIHKISMLMAEYSERDLRATQSQFFAERSWVIASAMAVFLLSLTLSMALIRRVSGAIEDGIDVLEEIGKGHFSNRLGQTRKQGEIGRFMSALQQTQEQLSHYRDLSHHREQNMLEALDALEVQKGALDQAAMVMVTNIGGVVTYVNQNLLEFTGYQKTQILHQNASMLGSGNTPKPVFEQMWKEIHAGRVWRGEVENRKPSGELYWVLQTVIPIRDIEGSIFEFLSIQFDITPLKEAQRAQQDQIEQLEAFQSVAIDRESRMIDLKRRLGEPVNPVTVEAEVSEHKQIRILAVDDDLKVLDGYRSFLESSSGDSDALLDLENLISRGEAQQPPRQTGAEFELVTTHSGAHGVELIQKALDDGNPFQVLYLDMVMPGGWSGLETAEAVRAVDKEIRIVVISAWQPNELEEIQCVLGKSGYIFFHKPYNHDELLQITRYLAHDWYTSSQLLRAEQAVTHMVTDLKKGYDQISETSSLLLAQKSAMDAHAVVSIASGVTGAEEDRGKIVEVNDAFLEMTGYSREEVVGQRHSILSSGMHDAALFQDLYQTIQRGGIWKGEIQDRTKQGNIVWTSATVVPILDQNGEMDRYIMIRSDITDRIREEQRMEQLLENQKIYQMVLMALSTSDPLYSGDQVQGYREITQSSAEALRADRVSLWHYIHDDQSMVLQDSYSVLTQTHEEGSTFYPAEHPHLWDKMQSRQVARVDDVSDFSCCSNEGSYCNQYGIRSMMVAPLYHQGALMGAISVEVQQELRHWREEESTFLSYVSNIVPIVLVSAERRHAQEQLSDAVEEAEQASRAKGDFLATMSHELRTPLSSMIGYGEILLESSLDSDQKQLLNTISLSGKTLLALVNDILDLSKIEAGKLEVGHAPFDLAEIIFEVEQMFRQRAELSGLQLVVNREESDCSHLMIGDGRRLSQVLINLLGNAIKFTKQGEVSLTLRAGQIEKDGKMEGAFIVEDSGIGMSAEVIERLFQPFEQADGTISRRFGGTGLGLHISRRLVNLMGGEIHVESSEGEGSRFEVLLPLGVSDQLAGTSNEDRLSAKGLPRALQGNVLIAEDTPELQQLERRLVESTGASVKIAADGNEAVSKALEEDYDLILMDMQMPERDGIEATQMLRAIGCSTPIVALTANVMQHHRDQFNEAGVNDFLSKPINRERLVSVLVRYLEPDEENSQGGTSLSGSEDPMVDDELRQVFVDRLGEMAGELTSAVEGKQWDEVQSLVHRMKGSGTSFGFPAITTLGKQAEENIRNKQYQQAEKIVGQLLEEINSTQGN